MRLVLKRGMRLQLSNICKELQLGGCCEVTGLEVLGFGGCIASSMDVKKGKPDQALKVPTILSFAMTFERLSRDEEACSCHLCLRAIEDSSDQIDGVL